MEEKEIGELDFVKDFEFGELELDIIEIFPELENVVITPELEEQNLKSQKYGYENITVKAIETEDLEILPKKEEQLNTGVYRNVKVAGDENLVPENIKSGVEIFGVEGNVIELKGQEKEISPSIQEQTIVPEQGYNAITSVKVKPVTAAIDNNIKPENIKYGASILGVEGDFTADGNIEPEDVMGGKIGYSQGKQIVGTYIKGATKEEYEKVLEELQYAEEQVNTLTPQVEKLQSEINVIKPDYEYSTDLLDDAYLIANNINGEEV